MKKSKIISRRENVFLHWLISYVLILIIPIIVSAFAYYHSISTIKTEVERSYKISLSQMKTLMDDKMEGIIKISTNVLLNDTITGLAHTKEPFTMNQYYTMLSLQRDFSKLMASDDLVKGIYVYFNNQNLMLSNFSISDKGELELISNDKFGISNNELINLTGSSHVKEFRFTRRGNEDGQYTENILFLQTIPFIGESNHPAATLIIVLDTKKLYTILKNYQQASRGAVIIVNSLNEYLSSENTGNYLPGFLNYKNLGISGEVFTQNEKGQEKIIIQTLSDANDWKYVSILPSYIFLEKIKTTYRAMYAYIVICLILGVAAAYIMAKRNYHPLKKLTQLFASSGAKAEYEEINEFRLIEHSFRGVLEEKQDLKKRLDLQKAAVFNSIFSRLLKGYIKEIPDVVKACESQGLYFKSDYFIAMAFEIEDIGRLHQENNAEINAETMNLANYTIANIVEELANENHIAYAGVVDASLICLVNVMNLSEDARDKQNVKYEMEQIAHTAAQFAKKGFGILFTVGISELHSSFSGIAQAYSEVLEVIEYKRLVGISDTIIHHSYIRTGPANSIKGMHIWDKRRQFVNLVIDGDYKNARHILNDIVQMYFSSKTSSLQLIKYNMFGLINLIMDALMEINTTEDLEYIDQLKPMQRLLNSGTISDLQKEVNDIFQSIIEYSENKKNNDTQKKIEKIIDYIDNHYYEPDFCAATISDYFDLRQSYLSSIFKKHTGMGVLDYINKVRIEKVKELLNVDLKIKDIALKVGYYNSLTLIRAFKRYEGVTPGKYRENMGKFFDDKIDETLDSNEV